MFIIVILLSFTQALRDPFQISSKNYELVSVNSTDIQHIGEYYYQIAITIGTPPQDFYVLVDTGSGILWVANETCINCQITNRFYPNDSSTYTNLNEFLNYSYTAGDCSGYYGTDIVTIYDTPISANFKFLLANQESDFNFDESTSGIMGLSNSDEYTNLFQAGYAQGQLSSQLFGFILNKGLGVSYLLYDEFNQDVLDETIWINTNENGRWSLELIGFEIDGNSYKVDQRDSIFDTGTTCIFISESMFDSFAQFITCDPCLCNATYPDLTFYFQGAKVTVTQDQYLIREDLDYCSICVGPSSSTNNVLGDPFLQSFIPVFNKESQQIGLYDAISLYKIDTLAFPLIIMVFDVSMLLILIGYTISYVKYLKYL